MSHRHLLPALLALSILLSGCTRSPQKLVEIGNQLAEKGKLEEASLNYRRALQKDPNNGEAVYRLAQAEFRQNHVLDGYRLLVRATELMPNRTNIKVELADFLLMAYLHDGRQLQTVYDQLRSISDQLLKTDPNSIDGLRILGHLNIIDQKPQDAVDVLKKAYSLSPKSRKLVVPLAQALIMNNQPKEAEDLCRDFIASDKTFEAVYDTLYTFYMGSKRLNEADQVLVDKAKNNPKSIVARLQLALHYYRSNRSADMTHVVSEVLSDPQNFPNGRFQVGDFYVRIQQMDDAIRTYEEGLLQDASRKVDYQKRIIQALQAKGDTTAALTLAEKTLAEHPNDDSLRVMRAALALNSGKTQSLDESIKIFSDAVAKNPESIDLRMNLAKALSAKANLESAEKELREALRQNPRNQEAQLLLASTLIRERKFKDSLSPCDAVLAEDQQNQRASLLKATALMGLGQNVEARTILKNLITAQPNFLDAQLQLGLLNITEKKYKEADDIFRRFYQPGQGDIRPLDGMVESHIAQQQFDTAIQLLTDELKKSPSSAAVRYTLANTYVRAGRYDAAVAEFDNLIASNPKSVDLLLRAGEALVMKGEFERPIRYFDKALELQPKNPGVLAELAYAHELAGRMDLATRYYRQCLELDSNNPVILNNLAYRLAEDRNNLEESLALAQRALQKVPGDPAILDTVGFVYLQKGMNDSALKTFENLAKKYPNNATFLHHLALTQFSIGDKQNAKRSAEKALISKPSKVEEAKLRELISRIG